MPLLPATPDEFPAIAAIVNGAYRGAGGVRGWTTEDEYIAGDRTDAAALARDLAAEPAARLLAWRDEAVGPILGCVWLEPAGADAWYIGLLTVRPDLQDRKLGRALLEAAEAHAAGQGARRIRMTVVNLRGPLIAWYERRGYRRTGETQPFPYDEPKFGAPRRPDLAFVVLEKALD
jgi:ribosomal protein S18 acetylase RimI-like enzyme